MFDVEKLVSSVLAFVNFFAARIAVLAFILGVTYRATGTYYFDAVRAVVAKSPVKDADITAFITKAGTYVSEANTKNAIFVITLIIALSLLDITYRAFRSLGSVLPIGLLSTYTNSWDPWSSGIWEAWRYYSTKFTPHDFHIFVEQKASASMWKDRPARWSSTLFDYTKSFAVFILAIYLLTPRAGVRLSLFDVFVCFLLAFGCMMLCSIVESARYFNDFGNALHKTSFALIEEAKDTPISPDEVLAVLKAKHISPPPPAPWQWRKKLTYVRIQVYVPYFGTLPEWASLYRNSKFAKRRARPVATDS